MGSDLLVDGFDWVVDPFKCELRDDVACQQSRGKGQWQPNICFEEPKSDKVREECDVEADHTALLKKTKRVKSQRENVGLVCRLLP
jgi:hypothetical protein